MFGMGFVAVVAAEDEQTEQKQREPCDCLEEAANGLPTALYFSDKGYDPAYGSTCKAWDEQDPYCRFGGAYYGEAWCTSPWCYVSNDCPSGIATIFFADTEYDGLEWSMDACATDGSLALYTSAVITLSALAASIA